MSVNIPNDSDTGVSKSDLDDYVVVCRKSNIDVLYSEDNSQDGEISCTDSETEEAGEWIDCREMPGSAGREAGINFTNCSDKQTDELSSDRSSTAHELTDSFDAKSQSISNNIAESKIDSTPLNSSIADDAANEDEADKIQTKISNILDSDSEDERIFGSLVGKKINLSRSASPGSDCAMQRENDDTAKPIGRRMRIVNSESEGDEELADQKEPSICKSVKLNKISRALIDSDSEEDRPPACTLGGSSGDGQPMIEMNVTGKKGQREKKKRSGSIRAAKEDAMREIHSESQRMLRESQVSLPYHRPRQRTLQEFLNRKKGLPILPKTLTTAAKIKMSGELVGKALEEKEKEAELFYKSSSDSDNEEGSTMQNQFAITESKPKRTLVEDMENNSAIEETQKVERNDLKNGQGVKEVLQQGDKSLGIPRKLFTGSANEAETTQITSPVEMDHSELTTSESQDCIPRRKGFRRGLQNVSMPRKLFGSECDESIMNIDAERNNADREGGVENDIIQENYEPSNNFLENETTYGREKNSNVQRNESIENEVENFELKMSEDSYEMTSDKIILCDIANPRSSTTEVEAMTETPFIGKREISKLNDRKDTETGAIITDGAKIKCNDICHSSIGNKESLFVNSDSSCSNGDSDHERKPFGHVYGVPLPEFDDKVVKKSKTRILPDIMRLTPKLQGSPDMLIELSPPKVGVNKLIQRFFNHSVVKKTSESCVEVTAMGIEETASGLRVVNEILPYRMPVNKKNDDPGAKLMRLKEELQQQMAIQRTKEWKQKELDMKTLEAEDIYQDELSDCGMEDRDDVVEEDKEEESSDGDESELNEADLPIMEKQDKQKSPFVDAEAEVVEAESCEKEGGEESDEDDQEDVDESTSENLEDEDAELESKTGASPRNKTWKSRRIIKVFDDEDSDDSEMKGTDTIVASNNSHFRRTRTDVDMFATDTDDDWLSGTEEDLPVYQQRRDERSQSCATPSVLNNSLSIVSPITQLTALNTGTESSNIDSRSGQNPLQFVAPPSVEVTPIEVKCYRGCNSEKRDRLQKKLFDDVKETPNDTELMGLCSGQFTDNPSDNSELAKLIHTARRTSVSDAELLDLCSGTFASQPPVIERPEACSATDSSFPSTDKSSKVESQKSEAISGPLKIISSSDEENDTHNSQIENARKKKFKKRARKLNLSDEEDDSDAQMDLSDFEEKENGEDELVDYDSEENEIVLPKNDARKTAARFIDEEAELSESEWGSADEDEKGLDKLDWEEGDLEDIDQDQVKKQLEKIHMRQVLDADQREVRLLQEILLEDGELHSDSASRQRKYKWKSIDEMGADSEGQLHSLDEEALLADPNEVESELEWRKQRMEREKFLQEQRDKESAEDAKGEKEEDSQLYQLGMRALKKNKNNRFPNKDVSRTTVPETSITRHTVADLFASPGCGQKTFALQNAIHRGSFLARGEESLARLSAITKQNSDQTIIRTKNSRNFVFAHLSPAIEATAVESETELDGQKNIRTTDSKFRKRKPPSSLTPVSSKKSKTEYEHSDTRNNLFS